MGLKRGDLVIVSAPGNYGKPRPSVVIQSDNFDQNGSLTVLLMTTEAKSSSPLIRYRLTPNDGNGLHSPTDVMIDKIFTVPRERLGQRIGQLTGSEMVEITAALAIFLGIRARQH